MTASVRGCVFDTEHNGVWFHMEKTLNIYTPGHVSLVKLLVLDDSPSYTPKALFLTPSLLILGFSPSILHEILNLLDPVPLSSLSHLFLWSSWILFVYGVDPQVNFLFLLQVSIVKHSHSAPPPPFFFPKITDPSFSVSIGIYFLLSLWMFWTRAMMHTAKNVAQYCRVAAQSRSSALKSMFFSFRLESGEESYWD